MDAVAGFSRGQEQLGSSGSQRIRETWWAVEGSHSELCDQGVVAAVPILAILEQACQPLSGGILPLDLGHLLEHHLLEQ